MTKHGVKWGGWLSIVAWLFVGAGGCGGGDDGGATALLVEVSADRAVCERVRVVRVRARGSGPDGGAEERSMAELTADACSVWPLRGVIRPLRGDARRQVLVVAEGLDEDGSVLAQVAAATGFVSGQTRLLRLHLSAACLDVRCAAEQDCTQGTCRRAPWEDPNGLPRPGAADSGMDAGMDAGMDSGMDSGMDAGMDAGMDSGMDAGMDAGMDSGMDAGMDSGMDAGMDSGMDAGMDCPASCPGAHVVDGTCEVGFREVALGIRFGYAVDAEGGLWRWGSAANGELGGSTGLETVTSPTHFSIMGVSSVTELVVGNQHVCVSVSMGNDIYCWGANDLGQLGRGTRSPGEAIPARVSDDGMITKPVQQVVARAGHTCVLDGENAIYCWGRDVDAEIGQGTSGSSSSYASPQRVGGGGAAWSQLFVGYAVTWAKKMAGGSIWAWGKNHEAETGSGGGALTTRPTHISAFDTYMPVRLAGGWMHSCVVTGDGKLRCWGCNDDGQLGRGDTMGTHSGTTPLCSRYVGAIPVVAVRDDVADVALGQAHTCAISYGGALRCWGRNDSGQTGTGSAATPVLAPSTDPILTNVTRVAASDEHSCAVDREGSLWCWGRNDDYRLGTGDTMMRDRPVRLSVPCP